MLLAHFFLVEISLEAHADAVVVMAFHVSAPRVARAALKDLAVLVDVIMIADASPTLVEMPLVDILHAVPSAHFGVMKDDVICF